MPNLDPSCEACDAHGPAGDPLATALHEISPNGDPPWRKWLNTKRHRCQKTGKTLTSENIFFTISLCSSAWAEITPKRVQLGAKLWHVGPKLGRRSWGLVGQSWPQVEPMLRTCGIETVNLNELAPICKRCKLPTSGLRCSKCLPPQLRL